MEERTALENCVWLYEPGIIYLKEIPIQTPFSIQILLDQVDKLSSKLDSWGLLVDLTEARPPNAIARRSINEKFLNIIKTTNHISFYTNGILLNTAMHFVMYGWNKKKYTVDRNLDKALAHLRNAQL